MDIDARQSLFGWLLELGTIPAGALVFSLICTGLLICSRIRRSFRFGEPTPVRDVALLFSGPVCAVLISIIKVASGGRSYMRGGIDTDFEFIASLDDVVGICLIGIVCFVAGVVSIILPTKSNGNVA